MSPDCHPQTADIGYLTQLSLRLGVMHPGGGRPRGELTEIVTAQRETDVLRVLKSAVSQRCEDEDRWICWVAPPWIPAASTLQGSGIDLSRVLLVHPKAHQDGLSAIEQSLGSGTCSVVLAWLAIGDSCDLRRLKLAAEEGGAQGLLVRSLPGDISAG